MFKEIPLVRHIAMSAIVPNYVHESIVFFT